MKLFWDDIEKNKYYLGELYKKDNKYYFILNESGLSSALKHGCFGIGTINITKKINESTELFDFLKNRVPPENSPNAERLLKIIGLDYYDEYEILKRTHGYLLTNRYYLED